MVYALGLKDQCGGPNNWAPPTKTCGLNCLVSVTLRTGEGGFWVALIKLKGNCGVPGFGDWLRVALIKLEGDWGVPWFGGLRRRVWDCLVEAEPS